MQRFWQKKDAAVKWCEQASSHASACGGKPWKYSLIPHDQIAVNMTIEALAGELLTGKAK
jgi:type III restriction enzyme